MGIAQIILLAFYGAGLLLSAHLHGKPMDRNYNFWKTLLGTSIAIGLLYWGGFFN